MSFNATRIRAWSDSEYDYTETSYYLVTRAGTMEFVHVPVDGSVEMDDDTTESIEPFDYSGLTDFRSAYLAGYETDKYDVDAKKYQFAINGQTGKMVGELPVDQGAFWRYLGGFTAIGTVVCSILGILLFGGV